MVEANSFVARYSIRNAGVGGDIETIIITYPNGTTWVHWQNQFDVTDKEGKQWQLKSGLATNPGLS